MKAVRRVASRESRLEENASVGGRERLNGSIVLVLLLLALLLLLLVLAWMLRLRLWIMDLLSGGSGVPGGSRMSCSDR